MTPTAVGTSLRKDDLASLGPRKDDLASLGPDIVIWISYITLGIVGQAEARVTAATPHRLTDGISFKQPLARSPANRLFWQTDETHTQARYALARCCSDAPRYSYVPAPASVSPLGV